MNHLHNIWLETAAESGLPAAAALALFLAARWWGLAVWWRRGRGWDRSRAAGWIALELMILAAGMGFYMLKQNSGMLTWWVWAYAALAAEAGLRAANKEQSPDACPP
jgi:O-antigen ligase